VFLPRLFFLGGRDVVDDGGEVRIWSSEESANFNFYFLHGARAVG
jgi:hypothetical protein